MLRENYLRKAYVVPESAETGERRPTAPGLRNSSFPSQLRTFISSSSSRLQTGPLAYLAMSKFSPSPQEVSLVNQIFAQADTQKIGVVTGEAAVKVFSGSKLSPSVLAEIWNLADEDKKGVLTRKDVAVAVRLLGHAQRGERVAEAHILRRESSRLSPIERVY